MTASRESVTTYFILQQSDELSIFGINCFRFFNRRKYTTRLFIFIKISTANNYKFAIIRTFKNCYIFFHCSKPSFALICIYRIHQNAAFVY